MSRSESVTSNGFATGPVGRSGFACARLEPVRIEDDVVASIRELLAARGLAAGVVIGAVRHAVWGLAAARAALALVVAQLAEGRLALAHIVEAGRHLGRIGEHDAVA